MLAENGTIKTESCERIVPMHKIGTVGVILMSICLVALWTVIIMSAYYNCKVFFLKYQNV